MNQRRRKCPLGVVLVVWLSSHGVVLAETEGLPWQALAETIVDSAGIRAGPALCVHLGCEGGELCAELARTPRFLVHGLCLEVESVVKARRHLQTAGLYGRASVERASLARLPYADNLVNLVVADELPKLLKAGLALKEVMRILCPDGVAFLGRADGSGGPALSQAELRRALAGAGIEGFEIVKKRGIWAKIRKARPAGMDEWTHPRHGPDGNMTSKDRLVKPPTGFRWIAGPTWPNGPRTTATIKAFVSAKGRNVCLTPNVVSNLTATPERVRWYLVARDAYNGLFLWSRPWKGILHRHFTELGYGAAYPEGQRPWRKPLRYTQAGTRIDYPLVAAGDRLYTSVDKHVGILDAATGRILRKSEELESFPEFILARGNSLIVSTQERVYCLDPASGKTKWQFPGQAIDLLLGGSKVFFLDCAKEPYDLVSVDLARGTEVWRKSVGKFSQSRGRGRAQVIALRVYADERLFLTDHTTLYAVSARNGSHLWTHGKLLADKKGQFPSVFHADGLIFPMNGNVGLDPATGEVRKRGFGSLTRGCQTHRMTNRYHIGGRWILFSDLRTKQNHLFYGARGTCREGVIPANGLLYSFPQSCCCGQWVTAARGFLAMASDEIPEKGAATRLETGPAFGKVEKPRSRGPAGREVRDWPTFKHDAARSGSTPSKVPAELKLIWEKELAGRFTGSVARDWNAAGSFGDPLTGPVIANGKIFVALSEEHRVTALDEESREVHWSYTAGARIDSPPTISGGLCVFGCYDGWVYCLRAEDGELVWRFRAAPQDKRIMVFGQLESCWPVSGSVLVVDGLAYFVAGRNAGAAGGLRVFAVHLESGKPVWEKRVRSRGSAYATSGMAWEKPGKPGTIQAGAMRDVMVSNGKFAYLTAVTPGLIQFNLKSGKAEVLGKGRRGFNGGRVTSKGQALLPEPDPQYLAGPAKGILDGTWRRERAWLRTRRLAYQRTTYGPLNALMLVFDQSRMCGYDVGGVYWGMKGFPQQDSRFFGRRLVDGKLVPEDKGWNLKVPKPAQFEAILLSGDTLFAAGAVNGIAPKEGTLWAISAGSGDVLGKHKLASPPAYHGVAAANDRLYISTQDG